MRMYVNKQKRGILWNIPRGELENLVSKSNSLSDILRGLKLSLGSGNWFRLKKRLVEEGIDITHISLGMNSNKGRSFQSISIPISEMLIENSTHARANVKRRLLKEGLIENICSICGQLPVWHGKTMILILDHINGINNDNRIENLRLVCPNCNSQLPTTNRNHTHRPRKEKHCKVCGKTISKWGIFCRECVPHKPKIKKPKVAKPRPRKTIWPSKEELEDLVKKLPMTTIGKMFGVSDNAVRKWCKHYEII